MAWVRIDDTMTFNPKVVTAGNAAVGAWVRMSAYSSAHGLDGKVPESVARMVATAKELDAAVRARLLHFIGGWYEIHDFLVYNPTAEEVAARRVARAQAGSNGGKQKASKRLASATAFATPLATDTVVAKVCPVPSRPVPFGEKTNGAPARVMDDSGIPAWFVATWLARTGALMIASGDLAGPWARVLAYANAAGRSPEDVAGPLFDGYAKVTSEWDTEFPWEPGLFVKHFERAQAAVGKAKDASASTADRIAKERGDA